MRAINPQEEQEEIKTKDFAQNKRGMDIKLGSMVLPRLHKKAEAKIATFEYFVDRQ
jgi:hypothetical protein